MTNVGAATFAAVVVIVVAVALALG